MTDVVLRAWRDGLEDATHLNRIMVASMPEQPAGPPEATLANMWKMIEGIEEAARFALWGGEPVGTVALSKYPSATQARLGIGVTPSAQGRGIGKRLLEHALTVAYRHDCESIRTSWFTSNPRSVSFARSAGFVEKDKVFWSVFDVTQSLPSWAYEKRESFKNEGLRIVTGDEFEEVREDWDRVWWRLMMDSLKDVPRAIPFNEIPFEIYRPLLDLQDRSLTLLALEGRDLVGILSLRRYNEAVFNIQTTNVAKPYRRRGISTALKCAAVERILTLGGKEILTQNHERNPMFALNMALGFIHHETNIDGVLML